MTDTTTGGLASWLLEQIAADERRLDGDLSRQWHEAGCHAWMSAANRPCECGATDRLRIECDTKRKIVSEHADRHVASLDQETWAKLVVVCRRCRSGVDGERRVVAPCPTLRLLALLYSDSPGYRAGWRP